MFKLTIIALAVFTYGVLAAPEPEAKAEAKPGVLAAAPLVATAPAVVTATSSQSFVRNYNALAAPLVAAPVAAAPYVATPGAPLLASPYVSAYASPYIAAPYLI